MFSVNFFSRVKYFQLNPGGLLLRWALYLALIR